VNPDLLETTEADSAYLEKLEARAYNEPGMNPLTRWVNEKWVNVCQPDFNKEEGYAPCGSGKGIHNIKHYPYCRPFYKLPGTTVKTVGEFRKEELEEMCRKKQSLHQGVDGKPTRIFVNRLRNYENEQNGGNSHYTPQTMVKIPKNVRKMATLGNQMKENGFYGSTKTGWVRGEQLANDDKISLSDLSDMRRWFARHGPDASNNGTSYPGYINWIENGSPLEYSSSNKSKYRGAVSWLLWGGSVAYLWLKNHKIQEMLESVYPNKKEASSEINLLYEDQELMSK